MGLGVAKVRSRLIGKHRLPNRERNRIYHERAG
jgi:hypothetical protein